MFISVFDIFKIGIGPSSSHTIGPMVAARRFVLGAAAPAGSDGAPLVVARLFGSLAYTGEGHGTHRAVLLGLLGYSPDACEREEADARLAAIGDGTDIALGGGGTARLEPKRAIEVRRGESLPGHPNAMVMALVGAEGETLLAETYYSVGGGFVVTEAELAAGQREGAADDEVTHGFGTASEMLAMGAASGLSLAEMTRANEAARDPGLDIDARLDGLWSVMSASIDRGHAVDGELPGGLKVKRRAKALHDDLMVSRRANAQPPHAVNDWLNSYAMAVNEENAAGGQVVTAPTNGAAGVVPAVMRYAREHLPGMGAAEMRTFLLTAGAIGGLLKANASISGAEVGCQGEVGSASAMAAAGLCAILGGSNAQIENAAEIALEHHLGMTCDPIRGLVQVPCIERNGMGAVKAVAAASLALHGTGAHLVSLDACIETMRQTGRDMDARYKETSLGGLSVAVPEC